MAKREANYHEFKELPAWTQAQWGEQNKTNGDRALLNEEDDYKWSGDNAPPAVGKRVKIYMNDFVSGTVVGYFAEYGWLGVLVKLGSKKPKWWVEQTKRAGKDPATVNCHFFGNELEPRKQKKEVA